jgi:putative peptidoglycan lipid II flippase
MIRLVYQRGEFDASQTHLVAIALFWFAFSLPFNGLFLLQTRTFFSLQRPWIPTAISGGNLVITALVALALYSSAGIGGIVAATAIATAASVAAQAYVLRQHLGGLELGRFIDTAMRVLVASAILAAVSYLIWSGLDSALGRSLAAQAISMTVALGAGAAVYLGAAKALRIAEIDQLINVVRRR